MKITRTILTVLCIIGFVGLMVGCAFQDYITPCFVNERVVEYTGAKLTNGPFTSIADAKRLGREMNFMSVENRETLLQEIEKSDRLHAFLADSIAVNLIPAQELQKTLFSPTGVFGAMTGLMGLGAGAVFFKRPGDLRPEDVENVA